jgi:hypothetical protein
MEWVAHATSRPLYLRERDQVSIVQEAGWALGPVYKGAENLTATAIRSLDRPARSELLYRRRYPDPHYDRVKVKVKVKRSLYRLGEALRDQGD